MIKGPLVYAAVILAAILLVLSSLIALNRELFVENSTLLFAIMSIVAVAVVVVLVLMFIRIRKYHE